MNWDKKFESPFKSDVYFFSTRLQVNQHWGTPNPVTIRDKEFGAIRLRGYGIYSYHISDPKTFYTKVSGTRDIYRVPISKASFATPSSGACRTVLPKATFLFSIWRQTRSSSGKRSGTR